MRKAVGPLLKVFAYLVLLAVIGWILFIAGNTISLGIPMQYQIYAFVGLFLAGFLIFLLLYAHGQSVQALVEIQEQQAATRDALKEIATLLRERPSATTYEPRPMFAPEPSPAQPANDWRRPASAPEARPSRSQAPAPKPVGKVACSLCGSVQDAGQPACLNCGATFVTETSL